MDKRAKYTDIVFLTFFAWLICVTVFNHFSYNYVISVNNYAGFLSWLIVFGLKFKSYYKARYSVLVLLLFSLVNLISFTSENISFGSISNGFWVKNLYLSSMGINPIILLLSIIYCAINWQLLSQLYRRYFSPSDEEFTNEYNRKVIFYYDKFSKYNDDEFNVVFSDIKDYPVEAQEAINKIANEKTRYVI